MSKNLVTIVTPTYNKPTYLFDAYNSLASQTIKYWEWMLILDIPIPETAKVAYEIANLDNRVIIFDGKDHMTREYTKSKNIARMSWVINKYFPMIKTKYFAWLSDDDVLSPIFMESLLDAIGNRHDISYGVCHHFNEEKSGEWKFLMQTGHTLTKYGPNCPVKPFCNIDGGQILQTTSSYRALDWKAPEENGSEVSRYLDGIYLNELSSKFEFVPVNDVVLIHRNTLMSEYTKTRFELGKN